MDPFFLPIQIQPPTEPVRYQQGILLTGSCFTEHIGNHLIDLKFNALQNPNGILFDPLSVANSLISYLEPVIYKPEQLFYYNELWQSWKHHGIFSDTDRQATLEKINHSQQAAHSFLKQADWLIITLGSSFTYLLKEDNKAVANCHRAPARPRGPALDARRLRRRVSGTKFRRRVSRRRLHNPHRLRPRHRAPRRGGERRRSERRRRFARPRLIRSSARSVALLPSSTTRPASST